MKSTMLSLSVAALLLTGAQVQAQSDSELAKCEKPLGTLAVVEPQNEVLHSLQRFNLQSPSGMIRLMVQQSKCFTVVERGVAMKNMQQERALAEAGELRRGSNIGGGQMVGADFILTPAIVFSENNAGGIGAAIGGFLRNKNPALGAAAGGVKFKEAQTSMTVTDSRSGVQVAAADGKATKADLRLGVLLAGVNSDFAGAGAASGYTNTNEGKVILASFTDNYNKIVADVRASGGVKPDQTKAGAVFNEGDTLVPKINTKLYAAPAEGSKVITALSKGDEMIFTGEEKDGFLKVESGSGSGWVKKILVTR